MPFAGVQKGVICTRVDVGESLLGSRSDYGSRRCSQQEVGGTRFGRRSVVTVLGHHEESGREDTRGGADVVRVVAVTTGADYVALSKYEFQSKNVGLLGHTIPDLHSIVPLYERVARQLLRERHGRLEQQQIS